MTEEGEREGEREGVGNRTANHIAPNSERVSGERVGKA